jgi:hypothetical protein
MKTKSKLLGFSLKITLFVLCGGTVSTLLSEAEIRLPEGVMVPMGEMVTRSGVPDDDQLLIEASLKTDADEEEVEVGTSHLPEELVDNVVQDEHAAVDGDSHWAVGKMPDKYEPITGRPAQKLLKYVDDLCKKDEAVNRLSLDGKDLLTFLRVATHYHFDLATLDQGLRKFYNTLKGCLMIDDSVVHQVLPEMVHLLKPYLNYQEEIDLSITTIQKRSEQFIAGCFAKYSNMLQEQPNDFLLKLSRGTARIAYDALEGEDDFAEQRRARERLRHLVIQIADLMVSKVTWAPHAFESLQPSLMRIGADLCSLGEANILIHMDDFKDVFWTLVQRVKFFIDLNASVLPSDCFKMIKEDVDNHVFYFLEYEEHQDLREDLLRALTAAEVKSLAYEHVGIIT